jgi:glycerophosphoryl diester phosphodiesterase
MIDEYITAGVPVNNVWPQSFNWDDVIFTDRKHRIGDQEARLDDNRGHQRRSRRVFDYMVVNSIKIVAPPMYTCLSKTKPSGKFMVASHYAQAAKKERGLGVITWDLGTLNLRFVRFYYGSTDGIRQQKEITVTLLHVLYLKHPSWA